ncbi:uncharacterized protein SPAPADRAFT_50145 [Spathaspora passalidarum NRRL Y-27907]|uniref:U1 small nuclear ribonucleoprotein component SNU71 n=1 Tax=Spathaspora passalidarum (strain NRRL Y-27907 / 11-Y1) TaxID=619300 RepID=G3ALK5_SPAPN|nr:uncharacterized protein SPAPADRAFT_50145 [Spathaspora passalidarum NRRL Y-27907]EGW33248.1 hypothetical protein SPAPADRAFT_50145 [Spathaspora passalidarum NRRL Y-27907]
MTRGIITVSPYSIDQRSNILSLLKNPPPAAVNPKLALTVPTLSSLDTSSLINLNTTRIHAQDAHRSGASLNATNTDVASSTIDQTSLSEEKLAHYVPISSLQLASLKDQLNTIIIKNIANLPSSSLSKRLSAIERVLNMCMRIKSVEYTWSIINHEYLLDLNLVYVRFAHTRDVSWFLTSFDVSALFGGEVITNEQFVLDESAAKSEVPDSIKTEFQLQTNNTTKKSGAVDESQEILNYYKSQYKVDKSELVDIPNSMKEATILNILKFRSRVLIMEKENRKRELEKERVKTREKLKSLFEEKQIDTTAIANEEHKKEAVDRDEFEDMDEDEYKEYLEFKADEQLTKQYQDAIAKISIKESQRSQLLSQLEQLTNYEDNLIDNKLKHIDDIKNQDNHLVNLYNSNYSHYLKLRSHKRTLEQANDDNDRDEELEELKRQKPPQEEAVVEPPSVEQEGGIQVNVSQLQPKVIELVKEYLGINDDFLIEVINEHLSTHGLSNKTNLVEELTQVLDEDAISLVDDLWEYVKTTNQKD